jgi:hypothetical protein
MTNAEQIKKDILEKAGKILTDYQEQYPQFKEWDKKEAEKWLYRNRYNDKVIDDDIDFILFEYSNGSAAAINRKAHYKIPNKYYALYDFVKKIKAMPTHNRLYDFKENKPSLKPKGIPLENIQREAFSDFKDMYYTYRHELNLEKCAELLRDLKEDCPELYQEIQDSEKERKGYILETYEWAFKGLNEKTAELSVWEKTIHAIDKREITLKSLTGEIRGCRVPSYNDVKKYVNRIRLTVCNYYDTVQKNKEEMELFYPDLFSSIFNQEQSA